MPRALTLAQAQARYVHRYTMEHIPAWSRKHCAGKFYAPQFRSDAEWYANTVFPGEPGHFGKRDECNTSGQTWPCGEWLSSPFVKA